MNTVHVRELAAWGLDDFPYRPASPAAVSHIPAQEPANPILAHLTQTLADSLAPHATRPDLILEMAGLEWSLGVVDLRHLQAFQRRLSLTRHQPTLIPAQHDWPSLINFAFGPPRSLHYQLHNEVNSVITIITTDPNLHLRPSTDPATPFIVHGGSPFLEVARYRNRWFLRDGYHRAYALLQHNIFAVPAILIQVVTLSDLGADAPRFFPEEVLFSSHPPFVQDFLDDQLTITYDRPTLKKTIRLTIEESFTPESA